MDIAVDDASIYITCKAYFSFVLAPPDSPAKTAEEQLAVQAAFEGSVYRNISPDRYPQCI